MESLNKITDARDRPLAALRLSVTDRCNFRCGYCMPEETYSWLPTDNILSFEEQLRAIDAMVDLGLEKIRITGGEPLLRRELSTLVRRITEKHPQLKLAMTTNGSRLAAEASVLKEAGLCSVTVSLDTLQNEKFMRLTRRDSLSKVLLGIKSAVDLGMTVKTNTVLMGGVNDDEIFDILAWAGGLGIEARFIEYMDVDGATRWSKRHLVSKAELLKRLNSRDESEGSIAKGPTAENRVDFLPTLRSAPARRYIYKGHPFGIVASMTEPFCGDCDRLRLTADGELSLCLYSNDTHSLGTLLKGGASQSEIRSFIGDIWSARRDQGAQERVLHGQRGSSQGLVQLRKKPHLEMHTRGG